MQVLIELVLVQAPPAVAERLDALVDKEPEAARVALRLLASQPTDSARVLSWPAIMTLDEHPGEIAIGRGPLEGEVRFEVTPHLADGSLDLHLALDVDDDGWAPGVHRVDWRGALRVGEGLGCVAIESDLLLVVTSTVVTGQDVLDDLVEEKRVRDEALPTSRRGRRRALQELLGA